MRTVAELFDSVLLYTAAYPVTLWNVLVSPRRVFRPTTPSATVCPAGVCYVFTVCINYFLAVITETEDREVSDWLTPENLLMVSVGYLAVTANLQRFAINCFRHDRSRPADVLRQLRALSYAVSVASLFSWPFFLLILEKFDDPPLIYFVPFFVVYLWALFNVYAVGSISPCEGQR